MRQALFVKQYVYLKINDCELDSILMWWLSPDSLEIFFLASFKLIEISHHFDQSEFQNQVLVVHVSVISASISREPKQ